MVSILTVYIVIAQYILYLIFWIRLNDNAGRTACIFEPGLCSVLGRKPEAKECTNSAARVYIYIRVQEVYSGVKSQPLLSYMWWTNISVRYKEIYLNKLFVYITTKF
jgi:hypothetical protein